MRTISVLAALLALSAAACVNDSKNSDTASHGPAGMTGGDTTAATANTSGTGNVAGTAAAPTDTTSKTKAKSGTTNSH